MHIPVLKKEVLEYLNPRPNDNFVDATMDGGGHSLAILEKIKPRGKILGIELDKEIINNIGKINNLIPVCDSYVNLKKIVEKYNFKPVQGILIDLGMSSWHLGKSGRGFSFLKNEPLDMRYSLENDLTAERILNSYSQKEIEKILQEYGEERYAKRLARKIVEQRPIKTTFQLVEIAKKVRIYSLSRIFQALRIAVNDELNNLKKVLPQVFEVLNKKGRVVIISYHSLEDRIVKNFFKKEAEKELIKILTKKPIRPSEEEVKNNPRCRSAKLRAALKQ